MFCFQCQETAKNTGCTVKGVCGKPEDTANLQDLLIYALRGLSVYEEKAGELGISNKENGLFAAQALFTTITNANWDNDRFVALIKETLKRREVLKEKFIVVYKEKNGRDFVEELHHSATWFSDNLAEFEEKAKSIGVLATGNEDVRSLRELLII
ncbi:MAG: hydroxylamine reductase, partial [Desulfobacteraceae bacterium]|nr:hydroxylamine reductase [Desulfobacteraceae bacterium]